MDSTDKKIALAQFNMLLNKDSGPSPLHTRTDSWENLASGVGTQADKAQANNFSMQQMLPPEKLEALWRRDGIAKTIMKAPAKDATKNWIAITDDADSKILRQLKKLKAKKAFTQMAIDQRKFGGGVILLQTKRGESFQSR